MFHISCIVLTLCSVILWQTGVTNAKSSVKIDREEIECDICIGAVSLGKLFLVSPVMDSIKKMLVGRMCTLPGIMTKRCIHWGYKQVDNLVVQLLKQSSSKPCKYVSYCPDEKSPKH
ncbi:unnamed protein product [Schistosoma turkestanicum]|nr:unnamed protein product [Schistosoma turkestanicum]